MGQHEIKVDNSFNNTFTNFLTTTSAGKVHLDLNEMGYIVDETASHWTIQSEPNKKVVMKQIRFYVDNNKYVLLLCIITYFFCFYIN